VGLATFLAVDGPPSITPPVRTVVLPPSYGVTSVFVVSTYTRANLAFSRRDCFDWGRSTGEEEENVDTVVDDPYESEDEEPKEKHELELDERELEREWLEIAERGDDVLAETGNRSQTGVIQDGALISSASIANSSSSSCLSASKSCCAKVLPRTTGRISARAPICVLTESSSRLRLRSRGGGTGRSSDQTMINGLEGLPFLPKRVDTQPGSINRSNSRPPRSAIQSNHWTPEARQAE
jgi:hypothetical protein